MSTVNDSSIVSELQTRGLWGRQFNYYIYASMLPGFKTFAVMGAFSIFKMKNYILNLNENGLVVTRLTLMGESTDDPAQIIPFTSIKNIVVKPKWATFGIAATVRIEMVDGTRMILQANRADRRIEQQSANLKGIKSYFANKQ